MLETEYFKQLGWKKNPFPLASTSDLPIIPNQEAYTEVKDKVNAGERLILITAPVGYGKSTLVNYIIEKGLSYNGIDDIVLKRYRMQCQWNIVNKDLIDTLNPFIKLLRKPKNITNYLFNKENKPIVLFFDEIQDYISDEQLIRNLRDFIDNVRNCSVIFLGLPELEQLIEQGSFRDRVMFRYNLPLISQKERENMLIERIKWAGGKDITPFNHESVEHLCKSGTPREILAKANETIKFCASHGILEIKVGDVINAIAKANYEELKIRQ